MNRCEHVDSLGRACIKEPHPKRADEHLVTVSITAERMAWVTIPESGRYRITSDGRAERLED